MGEIEVTATCAEESDNNGESTNNEAMPHMESVAGPTGSTGTTGGTTTAAVVLTYTLSNVDFTKLTPEMKTSMRTAVTEGVVSGLGGAYTSNDIAVTLKAGSVVAEVTVTPNGETADELKSKATQATGELEAAVLAKVAAVPNFATVLTAGTVADVTVTGTVATSTTGGDSYQSVEDIIDSMHPSSVSPMVTWDGKDHYIPIPQKLP